MKRGAIGLTRASCLLFVSGACALTCQVAWLRDLRLVFGTSTAASGAVMAVFMGGLGLGGMLLGRKADRSDNALRLYARLELGVALAATATIVLGWVARAAYVGLGGAAELGAVGATAVRLALSALVLGPPTVLMGGTLPAAARAIMKPGDDGRRGVAVLYAANTAGAVAGTLGSTLFLLEAFGTRGTLLASCLVNTLVGVAALTWSRRAQRDGSSAPSKRERAAEPPRDEKPRPPDAPAAAVVPRWFAPAAAALSGATFMLMELVWYRMLAPLLGGSTYTYGVVLAVALAGIGLGAGIYARFTFLAPTVVSFAITCALEALAIAVPFALGDRVAIIALLLRPAVASGFSASVVVWVVLSSVVVLPAAIVAGMQFPLIVGLYGRGRLRVARDVGNAYLANTLGAIAGSLAGGFGLIPALSATGCWRLAAAFLAASAAASLLVAPPPVARGHRWARISVPLGISALAVSLLLAEGPTAVWRHSGIGAGRADGVPTSPADIEAFVQETRAGQQWEADGKESSIALHRSAGLTLLVNGKSDGHVVRDAPTQVMGGLLGALLHPNPRTALVVGLGTGETAGWLARVPSVEHVDVVELEPAVIEVARAAAASNEHVLDNDHVVIHIGDAREALLVSRARYDLVFSEPSNPYRAGVSSLYTTEFYEAVSRRLEPDGIFVQWLQAYDVGDRAVATTLVSLRQTFDDVSVWHSMPGDLLIVARHARTELDVDRLRERLASEPFATAIRIAWSTSSAEGILARHVAGPGFADTLVERRIGVVNHDDKNVLEFDFARRVGEGSRREATGQALRSAALALRAGGARTRGRVDVEELLHETWLFSLVHDQAFGPVVSSAPAALRPWGEAMELFRVDRASAFRAWTNLAHAPRSYYETLVVAHAAARVADARAPDLIARVERQADRDLLGAIHAARSEGAEVDAVVERLARALVSLRTDPWAQPAAIDDAIDLAVEVGAADARAARRLYDVLEAPFAVEVARTTRLLARARIGQSIGATACAAAFSALEPPPRKRDVLAQRAQCYRKANDPRASEAEADLARFEGTSVPFAELRPLDVVSRDAAGAP